jgi:hypothetical protein
MANRDEMSFSRAFADARREMGAGKTFTWRGDSYTTDRADDTPARGGRRGPATENAPETSPRPASRRSVGERIPRRQTSAEERPRVQRDPQDASPTTRARPPVQRDAQDMPPSVSRVIANAPDAAARKEAERMAQDGMERRMPLRNLINQIRDSIGSRRQTATGDRATSRSQAAADAASARRQAAQEARATRTGMAKGGLAKKGKTDRRKAGMFYDSKSPRGYK